MPRSSAFAVAALFIAATLEVLRLIVTGRSYAEIGREPFRRRATVKTGTARRSFANRERAPSVIQVKNDSGS